MNSLEQPLSAMSVSSTKLNTPELDWSAKSLSHPSRTYQKIAVINGGCQMPLLSFLLGIISTAICFLE